MGSDWVISHTRLKNLVLAVYHLWRIQDSCHSYRVATRSDFSGMSRFAAHVTCPASRHDPRRDVYVTIFWSKKLIRLNDSGIIDRSSNKY